MKKLLVALLVALLLWGCGTEQGNDIPPAVEKAAPKPSGPTGRIRGVVHLIGDAPAEKFEPISENQNICGDKVQVSRLSLGKDKGVQHAFVYLDGVQSTEKYSARES